MDDFQAIPWILASMAASVAAMFAALWATWRARVRDVKAEKRADAEEHAAEVNRLRDALARCIAERLQQSSNKTDRQGSG